jgi:hypothetical protein
MKDVLRALFGLFKATLRIGKIMLSEGVGFEEANRRDVERLRRG